jgi:hypothetical protein
MTVTTLSRTQWGGGALKAGHLVDHHQFRGIVAHHTVMAAPRPDIDDIITYMRRLQKARPDLGLEVPYSFVVFRGPSNSDCVVAEGRGFGVTGAHTSGLNSTRYGVAYAGNASVDPITPGVLAGYRWVGRRISGTAVATIGHRDTKSTECPGHHLYAQLDEIQPPFEEDDDMDEATFKEWFKEAAAADHKLLADMNHRVVKVLEPKLDEIAAKVQQLIDGT